MKVVEAQKIAEKIRGLDGIKEVVWIQVTERMTEFYIIAESQKMASTRRDDIQQLADTYDRTYFAVLPKEAFSWGYAANEQ
jgi:hypothetical protein